jgi:hypothetical protein
MSGKNILVTALVIVAVVLLFRGAGRWLVAGVTTLHGQSGGR